MTGPVPGPYLDARPVIDPQAMSAGAAGTTLHFWSGQAGEQVVDGVVDRPAGDHGVVSGGGHDVEDISLLQFEPPALAEPVGGICGHPPKRDRVCYGAPDHRLDHGHLRLKPDFITDAGPAAPLTVIRPQGGQITTPFVGGEQLRRRAAVANLSGKRVSEMSLSFGASTFSFIRQELALASMGRLRDIGYRTMDILAVPGHLWHTELSPLARSEFRKTLERDDIAVDSINPQPTDLNLGSCLTEVRAYSVGIYVEVIRLAVEIGARGVVVVPGRVSAMPPPLDDTLGWVGDSIDALATVARNEGLEVLLLENHPLTGFPTGDGLVRLLNRVSAPNVKVAYDVANAEFVGEDQLDAIRKLGPWLGQTHLSDASPGKWAHDPVGKGTVDFASILKALDAIPFTGTNIVEIISQDPLCDFAEASQKLGIPLAN
jgi:L-ribulose-5-phosphate 3-epimerase